MTKRRMHDMWVVYLLPPFAFAAFLFWPVRDVWHWF